MNAYSSIKDERTAARGRRLLSRAYRKGVREGIGAPALFFNPLSLSRTESIDASVAMAWKVVGKALKGAEKVEEQKLGKDTRKATAGFPARSR